MRVDGNGMIRVGYIIIARKLPGQLLRLVDRLCSGPDTDTPVVIHVDPRSRSLFAGAIGLLQSRTNIQVISTHKVRWGEIQMVDALLDCLSMLVSRRPEVTHIKHLSGQDYPVLPLVNFDIPARTSERVCDGVSPASEPCLGRWRRCLRRIRSDCIPSHSSWQILFAGSFAKTFAVRCRVLRGLSTVVPSHCACPPHSGELPRFPQNVPLLQMCGRAVLSNDDSKLALQGRL